MIALTERRTKQATTGRGECGAVLVEAAITLLGFLILLFAIMEGGRFFSAQQVLTNAAREGARLAVAPLSGTSDLPGVGAIEDEVHKFLAAAHIGNAGIMVERPVLIPTGNIDSEFTRVRVTLPYKVLTLAMFGDWEINLTGEALMRNETSP